MNRRTFLSLLGVFGIIPKLSPKDIAFLNSKGDLRVRSTTQFLIPCEDSEGRTCWETNIFGEYHKLIAKYRTKSEFVINSRELRFESERIYPNEPSRQEIEEFKERCFLSLRSNFHRLKPISTITDKIIV